MNAVDESGRGPGVYAEALERNATGAIIISTRKVERVAEAVRALP